MGVIYSVLEVIPLMSKAEGGKGGLVVNISSVLGLEPGHYMAIHSAAKHGIIGLTRCLAVSYRLFKTNYNFNIKKYAFLASALLQAYWYCTYGFVSRSNQIRFCYFPFRR